MLPLKQQRFFRMDALAGSGSSDDDRKETQSPPRQEGLFAVLPPPKAHAAAAGGKRVVQLRLPVNITSAADDAADEEARALQLISQELI